MHGACHILGGVPHKRREGPFVALRLFSAPSPSSSSWLVGAGSAGLESNGRIPDLCKIRLCNLHYLRCANSRNQSASDFWSLGNSHA